MAQGFIGGAFVNNAPWRELLNLVNKTAGLRVHVGVFTGTIAAIARIHEFGAPRANIPERSFIRATFRIRRDDLVTVQKKIATGILTRKITEIQAMEILGDWAVAAIQSTIIQLGPFIWTPLKPATVARKGSSAPLIDTGQLVQSISRVIVPRR